MRRIVLPAVVAVVVLTCGSAATRAGCSHSYLVTTNTTVQSNPDWCGGYGCYDFEGGPPLSDDAEAAFWALGAGDPVIGQGADHGALAQSAWLAPAGPAESFENGVYYYATTFGTTWAEPGIDGCVTSAGPPGDSCTVISVSDQHDGLGYFALLSQRSDALGNFAFDRPGGAPFTLAPTPMATAVGVARLDSTSLEITFTPPTIPAGALYLDPDGCDTDVVVGYKIYYQTGVQGGGPPVDRRREQWQVADGAGWPSPAPLDQSTTVQVNCGFTPIYLATSLVLDSGFELPHVSEQTGAIYCDPFCVDLDSDGWCVFYEVNELPGDCNDSNPDVHPYAQEINDGLDNQCPGFPGFGSVDEISGRAGFFDATDGDEFSWNAQSGATSYEVARSTHADFSEACITDMTADNRLTIAADPAPGETVHLLVRATGPLVGSWGRNSSGAERAPACP